MASILRDWSYRYAWFYDAVSRIASLAVGGERRLRQLAWQNLDLPATTPVLDLCCAHGPVTQLLCEKFETVRGLDASPQAIARAKIAVPQAEFVEAFAQKMPFENNQFGLVHISLALHEMNDVTLKEILAEVYRVLQPGGFFAIVDFHSPTLPFLWPGLGLFFYLFETDTAWAFIRHDLIGELRGLGFEIKQQKTYVGGSLQVIQAQKPVASEFAG